MAVVYFEKGKQLQKLVVSKRSNAFMDRTAAAAAAVAGEARGQGEVRCTDFSN
jgi:hypothetical protein